ncbi:chaplin family protein [Streptomyces fradiae]|uniref:chaplin family protein n=1 Tax=Streptomyces fradiae TaxID=1906 RepID=UPI003808D2DF
MTLLGAAQMVSPAWASGVGDVLSPAFGTDCANHHGTRADGITTHGTGAANGNLAGLPLGSPFNQCGGADTGLGLVNQRNIPLSVPIDADLIPL